LWLVLTHTHDGKALTYRDIAEKLGYGRIRLPPVIIEFIGCGTGSTNSSAV
jgi:hypothetical protein